MMIMKCVLLIESLWIILNYRTFNLESHGILWIYQIWFRFRKSIIVTLTLLCKFPIPDKLYNLLFTFSYPEKRNCSDLMKPGFEASCEMMNQTVQLLAGSLDKNMNKFTVQTYDFNIPYYCTCMLVPTP